jgi:hypothetical protein
LEPITGSAVISRTIKKIPGWISKFLKAWLAWFWHLSTVPKIVATLGEVIAVYLICSQIHMSGAERHSIVSAVGLVLFMFLIPAILFGRPKAS